MSILLRWGKFFSKKDFVKKCCKGFVTSSAVDVDACVKIWTGVEVKGSDYRCVQGKGLDLQLQLRKLRSRRRGPGGVVGGLLGRVEVEASAPL